MTSSAGNILLVDENVEFARALEEVAKTTQCELTSADSLSRARKLIADRSFDLVMLDLVLPDGNGMDLIETLDLVLHGQIVVVTGSPSIESAVRAVRTPVVEYLVKPVATDTVSKLMRSAHARAQSRGPAATEKLGDMLGRSKCMRSLFDKIRRVAPMDVCVFVHGESGTGKELVARALHDLGGRSGRFVAVNCGAIAPDLLSSQLFGHERGSFTGALRSHAGYFEQAEHGTLFLDEISEMPIALQVYLLRVLETRMLTRVGGSSDIPIDVRVVAATNCDPERAVREGKLRQDLYYRLLEFPLAVPPLRERREDIPLLARHFLDLLNSRHVTQHAFGAGALEALSIRPWRGNVRELRHVVQRLYIMSEGEVIEADRDAPLRSVAESDGGVRFTVGMTFDDIEREMLLKTLAFYGNNKRQAARSLGITAKTIYNRMSRYRLLNLLDGEDGIDGPDETGVDGGPAARRLAAMTPKNWKYKPDPDPGSSAR